MSTALLYFADLRARRIVKNYTTLNRWIKEQGFPAGRLLGPNTRAWVESEVDAWIASRPTDAIEPRGGARMRAAGEVLKKRKGAR
jgi:hypothetical protein